MEKTDGFLPRRSTGGRDPQEKYDEDLQEYENGQALESNDEHRQNYVGRFPRDFYRYSQDFRDREDGAPGIDQDFATRSEAPDRPRPPPRLMPEGDGESDSLEDREIREGIMAEFSEDASLGAEDVTVRVEDGVVTLSGTVRNAEGKRAIENSVESVPGVVELVDCLIIDPVEDFH